MNWQRNLNPVKNINISNEKKIFNGIKGKIKLNEPLKRHTTFKIGGRAKFFIEPKDIDDLKLLLNLVKRNKIPIFIIGRGSNILIGDKGIDGVVLRLSSRCFKSFTIEKIRLEAGSGVMLSQLLKAAQNYDLSGLEFLTGIPGTVGGALAMNAGTRWKNIGDLVENVTVMDYNGNIKTLDKKDIKFSYRTANLSKYIILSVSIKVFRENKEQIKERIEKYLDYRKVAQDLSKASAGCIFKNPSGYSAGRLIDLCGFKGKRTGDACVSKRHANFILNKGSAKANDVLKLMDLIKKEVKNKFNITLESEIKIWQ